ncbi:MAG: efflux RND transporter periplasmic adaptor subunit [Alphaproteobacteria bacterium]
MRKLFVVLAVAAIGTGGYLLARTEPSQDAAQPQAPDEAVPVSVAKAVRKPFPIVLPVIGNVQPYSTVAVKSRVDGQILETAFREGQTVNKGDLLFTLDPRPFEAAVRQSEANLARDKAQLAGAELDLTRYSKLATTGFGTQQKYEESKTAVDSLKATIKADQAALETALLNLGYTTIRAPITGRTGSVLIHAGNLVKANDTNPLVVINEVRPIYVAFAVPERYLPDVRRRLAEGRLEVETQPAGENEPPVSGQVTFVNNAVDTTTGTITLKATFANDDERLVPGAFVHVRLVLRTIENAVVVPARAVQEGQDGSYIYVVGPNDVAELHPITGLVQGGAEAAIESGVAEGDRVVTDGQFRLRPGVRVTTTPLPGAEPGSGRSS